MYRVFKLLFYLLFICSCSITNNENEDSIIDTACQLDTSTLHFDFEINYSNKDSLLISGDQSILDTTIIEELNNIFGEPSKDIAFIQEICHWVNSTYNWVNAGGAMIGVPNAKELYESKQLYGCHSAALMISSILRSFEFPVVMIETASISWAYNYKAGSTNDFIGHVMTEVFVEDKWILLDNNGDYVQMYDYSQPFIYTNNPGIRKLFVLAKGKDTWDYYAKEGKDTHEMMTFFAENIYCYTSYFDTNNYQWNN